MNPKNNVYFGEEAENIISDIINSHSEIFLICDNNTKYHCLPWFQKKFGNLEENNIIEIQSKETSKNIETACKVWSSLLQHEASRNSLIINLGGGIVSDLGGFVASSWKRGISFINIPTSLMSQVDAAIGGKNGINFGNIKNQLGFFQNAEAVGIFPELLKTLEYRELLSGFAEMLKYGLISDKYYWEELCQIENVKEILLKPEWIKRSIGIKLSFTNSDFKDKGIRQILNFGHTIGHALESCFPGKYTHGEALAVGMRAEALISLKSGLLLKEEFKEIDENLSKFFNTVMPEVNKDVFTHALNNDKKRTSSSVKYILLDGIGHAIL